ncbi:uncharacterized protein LOC111587317 isoform X2 [Amphiprion ocellaris]|uniref:uncharacterized protein LOC111587317 isoform X2 n=1 Tax=Amphiprion ocellaris TaxID=80972 RepID=UPI002410D7CE|nr:uncharacterized protein LOC111587317 isoform X2 [Amphiprion ocellaris]
MELWLKQATLAVVTVAAAAMAISSPTPVFLNYEEERVEVPAGSTLTLYCCLETHSRSWISWHFQPFGNSSNSSQIILAEKIINNSASPSKVECKDSKKKHSLPDVNETHSGLYYCQVSVDIPRPNKYRSKNKEVVIKNPSDSTPQIKWWMWVLVGVSAFILLVLIVVCILWRKCPNRSRAVDPIYANTHSKSKGSSPRPEMDHLKTVSSSQNLRTPSPGQRYGEGKRRPRQ